MTPEDRAQSAVQELERAMLDVLAMYPQGLGNADIARALGLFSPAGTSQRNRVTWWALNRLEESGRVTKTTGARPLYKLV